MPPQQSAACESQEDHGDDGAFVGDNERASTAALTNDTRNETMEKLEPSSTPTNGPTPSQRNMTTNDHTKETISSPLRTASSCSSMAPYIECHSGSCGVTQSSNEFLTSVSIEQYQLVNAAMMGRKAKFLSTVSLDSISDTTHAMRRQSLIGDENGIPPQTNDLKRRSRVSNTSRRNHYFTVEIPPNDNDALDDQNQSGRMDFSGNNMMLWWFVLTVVWKRFLKVKSALGGYMP